MLTLRASNMPSYAGQVSLPGGKADTLTETPFETARRETFEEIGLPADHLPAPFRVEHLCELPSHLAITELGVRPCVAFLHTDGPTRSKGPSFTPSSPSSSDDERLETTSNGVTGESLIPNLNPTEVAAVFSCPFHRFLSSLVEHTQAESPIKYRGQWNNWNGVEWRMHNFFIPKFNVNTAKGKNQEMSYAPSHESSIEEYSYKVWGLTARILIDSARVAYNEDPEFEINHEIGEESMLKRLWDRGRLKFERRQGDEMTREAIEIEKNDVTESTTPNREQKENKL